MAKSRVIAYSILPNVELFYRSFNVSIHFVLRMLRGGSRRSMSRY